METFSITYLQNPVLYILTHQTSFLVTVLPSHFLIHLNLFLQITHHTLVTIFTALGVAPELVLWEFSKYVGVSESSQT
jgi:ABC-type glucose/galactose transport system permease subunit